MNFFHKFHILDEWEYNQTLEYDESLDEHKQIVSNKDNAENLQNKSCVSLTHELHPGSIPK